MAEFSGNSSSVINSNRPRPPLLFEIAWEVANKVGGIYTVLKTKVPVTAQEYGPNRYILLGPYNPKYANLEVELIDIETLPDFESDNRRHSDKPNAKDLNFVGNSRKLSRADESGSIYSFLGYDSDSSKTHTRQYMHTMATLKKTIKVMRENGANVMFGRWLIESSPYVCLFDLGSCWNRLNEWKSNLWEVAQIPSGMDDNEMNQSIVFGYMVSWFLGEFRHNYKFWGAKVRSRRRNTVSSRQTTTIAHFHEWMSSVALVLINQRKLDIATIFTTHATLLGRYLCAGSADFYNHMQYFDVDYEAGKRGIYHRYCLERGAAHCADVFTTVSHITAYEAEHLLKRKPDGVLPNGLNVFQFSAVHEFQNLHAKYKQKIEDFVRGHFYGHLNFDFENTLYFFTSGRYEFRNKGVDMFLEGLSRVNQRLKHINSPITIVAFIIMPAPHHSYTVESLKGQAVMKQLHDCVSGIQQNIGKRLFDACAHGEMPNLKDLLTEEEMVMLKRRIFTLKRDSLPPVVTHNMQNDMEDQIINSIRRLRLFNAPDDRVKIVFHPEFISSNNPLMNMDYEDFVRGCHLGVFPSYYEPWGYTPAECTVMGVPSITTNLSGFGCFMGENIENSSDYGIYIIDRRMKSVEESIQQLSETMIQFCQKSRRQRINQRNRTERLSEILDWQRMGLEYIKARRLAMRRKWPQCFLNDTEWDGEWNDVLVDEDFEDASYEDILDAENPSNDLSAAVSLRSDSARDFEIKNHEFERLPEPIRPLPSKIEIPSTSGNADAIESPLETGKKIPEPFSAPGSPKLQKILDNNEEGMRELTTGRWSPSDSESPVELSSEATSSNESISKQAKSIEKSQQNNASQPNEVRINVGFSKKSSKNVN